MRLNNRRKIGQVLQKTDLSKVTTFRYLFSQSLAKQLLLSYYDQILKQYIPVINSDSTPQIFAQLKIANSYHRDSKLLELAAAQSIINQRGVREFRNMISDKTWYRLKKSLQKVGDIKPDNQLYKIRQKLDEFETIKLVDYPQLLINNDHQ